MPTKAEAQIAAKKVNKELFSLTPATLITLFEIDFSQIALDLNLTTTQEIDAGTSNTVFRFHNNVRFITANIANDIIWKNQYYKATPIIAEGFEIASKGTLPTPLLSLAVPDPGVPYLAILKDRIKQLDDLVGAKVTRIRTFAKFLDAANFSPETIPEGFEPNDNCELPRDIYYIDRKSNETKNIIEFELASILDVEGIKLPGRIVIANKCLFTYRGAGCLYEYNNRRVDKIHGTATESTLPQLAPPIANDRDEKIIDVLRLNPVDRGVYTPTQSYAIGDSVYVQKNGIKYYFVSKVVNPPKPPPNFTYWLADQCSKSIDGCRLRWGTIGNHSLPTSAFPASNKVS